MNVLKTSLVTSQTLTEAITGIINIKTILYMLLVYMPGILSINDQITIMIKEKQKILFILTKSQTGGL
jgi:hypothetical protein